MAIFPKKMLLERDNTGPHAGLHFALFCPGALKIANHLSFVVEAQNAIAFLAFSTPNKRIYDFEEARTRKNKVKARHEVPYYLSPISYSCSTFRLCRWQ
jgi:hypothetical protein